MPLGSSKDMSHPAALKSPSALSTSASSKAPKPRTICAFDLDNFYVACERLRNPALCGLPVGIQQKQILATCSYEARARGVDKLQGWRVAKQVCPELVIVNGEDLTMYRVQSRKVWKLVKSVVGPGCAVEKLGMDELFVDTTSLVEQHLRCLDDADGTGPIPFQCHGEHHFFYEPASTVGYAAPGEAASITQRHLIATHLAAYIREAIHRELGLTVSGGVADNKLMSKLLAAVNKPAKQTCLALNEPEQLQSFLDGMSLQKVPGFGYRTRQTIVRHIDPSNASADQPVEERLSIQDLRTRCTEKQLCTWLDSTANGTRLWDLLHGQDDQPVTMTPDFPAQISVEDSFGGLKNMEEVVQKARALTLHLIERIELELLEEPLEASPKDSASKAKRDFVRYPTQLRLSTRVDPASRESKSVALPAEMLDLDLSREARADFVTQRTLRPLLKAALSSPEDPPRMRILNVAVTNLSTTPPPRSVKGLMRQAPEASGSKSVKRKRDPSSSSNKREIRTYKDEVDESVLAELPESMQAEIRQHLGLKKTSTNKLASCEYKCGAVIMPGAMEAHLRWHRKRGR